jgi:hypothetical protein
MRNLFNMKDWAILTVLLYGLLLTVLLGPLLFICLHQWWPAMNSDFTVGEAVGVYRQWGSWLIIGLLMLAQALMLLVPLDIARRRLPARRKLLVPVLTTAFLLANLVFAFIFSIACAIFGDAGFNLLDHGFWVIILLASWAFWAWRFWKYRQTEEPGALMNRLTQALLKGSILEFLVAVPSHVIVRQRDVCCAPAGTFWGIATGLSIMLISFGPGVFFLFAKRFERLQPKTQTPPDMH